MKEKIEKILTEVCEDNNSLESEGSKETIKKALDELSTLIQEERKKDREMIYKDIQANYHITADEFYKQYIQSLDKGDKITSNTLTITEEELENASYTSSTIESEGK